MQIHVNLPPAIESRAISDLCPADEAEAEFDKDATLIRVNLRKLGSKSLAEIGLQFCLVCHRAYRPPLRIYWPMPCGHGYCSDCLRTEAKKVRQIYTEKWKELQQMEDKKIDKYKISGSSLLDSPGTTPSPPDDLLLPALSLSCPVCQEEASLADIGL